MSFFVSTNDVVINGVRQRITPIGEAGYALFGAVRHFERGQYYVQFVLSDLAIDRTARNDLLAIVDVAVMDALAPGGRQIVASSKVFRRTLKDGSRTVTLPFELHQSVDLEFRVQVTGRTTLEIVEEQSVSPDPEHLARYAPMLSPGVIPEQTFFRDALAHLRHAHENGIDVAIQDQAAIATIDDISLQIENLEDFQVLDEVFIRNDYHVVGSKPRYVIDVGMNVGFASLFFANDPLTRRVVSYEPFDRPFKRAQVNIAGNAQLSTKIVMNKVGLSDRDYSEEVNTVDGFTLGMTLKGLNRGEPEGIVVRDAASELRPILEMAASEGCDVFVKLDCEGSEFAIIESLEKADLLGHINAFMIEWHKEHSPLKDQRALLSPLLRQGYLVFDQTIAAAQIAGMLYAVNTKPLTGKGRDTPDKGWLSKILRR